MKAFLRFVDKIGTCFTKVTQMFSCVKSNSIFEKVPLIDTDYIVYGIGHDAKV